jgi:hypothetical protein
MTEDITHQSLRSHGRYARVFVNIFLGILGSGYFFVVLNTPSTQDALVQGIQALIMGIILIIFFRKLGKFFIGILNRRGVLGKKIVEYIQEDLLCRLVLINGFMLLSAGLLLFAKYILLK